MIVSYLEIILRLILGFNFFIFGLNGFFNFITLPEQDERMKAFINCLIETRFIMPSVKIIEILSGGLLILNFQSFFAWLLLGPIVFVITGAQILLNAKKGYGILVLTAIPYISLTYFYFDKIVQIFTY